MTTRYRDLRYLVGFGTQLLMYATPVIYPVSAVPEKLQPLIELNPLTPIVESFRYAYLGSGTVSIYNLRLQPDLDGGLIVGGHSDFQPGGSHLYGHGMSTTVISVENLSKAYRLGQINRDTLAEDLKFRWAKVRGKPNPLVRLEWKILAIALEKPFGR